MSSHGLLSNGLTIIGLHDEGEKIKKVDTIDFNSGNIYTKAEAYSTRYKYLAEELRSALETNNLELIFYISTQSAELWQSVSPKKSFSKAVDFITSTKGLGLINTHSGSLIGLVYNSEDIHKLSMIDKFIEHFDHLPMIFTNLKRPVKMFANVN